MQEPLDVESLHRAIHAQRSIYSLENEKLYDGQLVNKWSIIN